MFRGDVYWLTIYQIIREPKCVDYDIINHNIMFNSPWGFVYYRPIYTLQYILPNCIRSNVMNEEVWLIKRFSLYERILFRLNLKNYTAFKGIYNDQNKI